MDANILLNAETVILKYKFAFMFGLHTDCFQISSVDIRLYLLWGNGALNQLCELLQMVKTSWLNDKTTFEIAPAVLMVLATYCTVYKWGRCGSGKSCRLAVGGLPVRSHPVRVEVSLSKTPNPRLLLTSWLVPCMAANRRWCVSVCVCE